MERKPSIGRRLALGCGGLVVLLLVLALAAYTVLRVVGGRQVRSALARVEASGAPTTWEGTIPPPVPEDENAAVLYEQAFALIALTAPEPPQPPRPKYPPYPLPDSSKRDEPRDRLWDYLIRCDSRAAQGA